MSILADGVGNLINATSLYLNFEENNIKELGAKAIGQSINHLLLLTNLSINLNKNIIINEGERELAEGLKKLSNL